MVKGIKIEEGRINEICKDLKRVKTYEGLVTFLIHELSLTCDGIDEDTEECGHFRELINKLYVRMIKGNWRIFRYSLNRGSTK